MMQVIAIHNNMSKYPYIQSKRKEDGVCDVCKEQKQILVIEWRVDWFQGNCEDENICADCLNNRENKQRQELKKYYDKMQPVWEKRQKQAEQKEKLLIDMLNENNISIKKYDNGQWSLNNIIDWWTTTGTAIERKSRKHHHFSLNEPEKIIKIINNLK